MPFDFKKEFKEFYLPKNKPEIVQIPEMKFLAVRGMGDPNVEGGDYQTALGLLYAVAYTLKMSYKTEYKIEGFFEYVVPPLEGFWSVNGIDYEHKENFNWISVIRVPDFVGKKDFEWALHTASKKKHIDCSVLESKVEFLTIEEGLCVQMMHHGPYDDEPASVELMHKYIEGNGYEVDFSEKRLHHEIYLSDPRKTLPEKNRCIIRYPVKKI